MTVLLLSDAGTRLALKNPEIAGRARAGRGSYSVVFCKGDDKVLRMTCDPTTYFMHCDAQVKVSGSHFATVTADFDEIGLQGPAEIPIYLFETERLVKPLPATAEKRLAMKLVSLATEFTTGRHRQSLGDPLDSTGATRALERMSDSKDLPFSMRKALSDLATFAGTCNSVGLDFHMNNIMMRASTGELVLNDPLHDRSLLIARDIQVIRSGRCAA